MSGNVQHAIQAHSKYKTQTDFVPFRIMMALGNYADKNGRIGTPNKPKRCPSARSISELAKVNRNTTNLWLIRLVEEGELSLVDEGGKGRGSWRVWQVNLPIQQSTPNGSNTAVLSNPQQDADLTLQLEKRIDDLEKSLHEIMARLTRVSRAIDRKNGLMNGTVAQKNGLIGLIDQKNGLMNGLIDQKNGLAPHEEAMPDPIDPYFDPTKTDPKEGNASENDQTLDLAWGITFGLCNGDEEAAANAWKLSGCFEKLSGIKKPNIDGQAGFDLFAQVWLPALVEINRQAGTLDKARGAVERAIHDMREWKPASVQTPRSIEKKVVAMLAADKTMKAPEATPNGQHAGVVGVFGL